MSVICLRMSRWFDSGRELTYSPGKDTGRYWDAGAANVHWVIATDEQVEDGIKKALGALKRREFSLKATALRSLSSRITLLWLFVRMI